MTKQAQSRYLDILSSPSYQGLNRLFVLLFEKKVARLGHTWYYLPTVEIKNYNVIINERNFFDQPVTNDIRTSENTRKNVIYQGDHYMTRFSLDYPYLKKNNKLIAIDLSKQQALDSDPKAIQQIN